MTDLCKLLADLIEANGSKRPRIGEPWMVDMDRLIRLDGRDPDEAEAIIRWSQTEPFWRSNILSPAKLREKYDTLRLQSQAQMSRAPARADPQNIFDPSQWQTS